MSLLGGSYSAIVSIKCNEVQYAFGAVDIWNRRGIQVDVGSSGKT